MALAAADGVHHAGAAGQQHQQVLRVADDPAQRLATRLARGGGRVLELKACGGSGLLEGLGSREGRGGNRLLSVRRAVSSTARGAASRG